jgi:hypothetical protein
MDGSRWVCCRLPVNYSQPSNNLQKQREMSFPTLEVKWLTRSENAALKACYAGHANAHQQRLALVVIVNKFCRANDLLYIPDHPDQTAFMNGRAFPGQQIMKHLKVPVGRLDLQNDDEESQS